MVFLFQLVAPRPIETSASPNGLPISLHLADGNGGEYRKSYHGFPAPVAYVIDSPQSVYVNPMFIDTWNRDKVCHSKRLPVVLVLQQRFRTLASSLAQSASPFAPGIMRVAMESPQC